MHLFPDPTIPVASISRMVESSPRPFFALEIGVTSKLIAESVLRMSGFERSGSDLKIKLMNEIFHPFARANNYPWVDSRCLVRLQKPTCGHCS